MKTQSVIVSLIIATSGILSAERVELPVEAAVKVLKELPKLQVLDVRTEEEFQAGHLKGAKLIPWTDQDFAKRAGSELEKDKPLLVYCRSGKRSAAAAKALEKLGFAEIITLEGGTLAWVKEGHELVEPE